MWRLRANRDSRRLRTAVPALIYGEGDPQVILVECRGQPLRWRKAVSTHALNEFFSNNDQAFVPGVLLGGYMGVG